MFWATGTGCYQATVEFKYNFVRVQSHSYSILLGYSQVWTEFCSVKDSGCHVQTEFCQATVRFGQYFVGLQSDLGRILLH